MQNLLKTLESVLKKDDRLVIDGVLAKNKIMELALSLDASLLTLLLSDEPLKSHFFTEVENTLIFDKQEFIHFVNNKNFLPDSYTSFKNKIGLMKEDGTYMSQSKDVVLAFPFKDCVLEGGQDKEDAKRKEIFWNTTLAPDEIDRLLDPKVFTNFKKYNKNGEQEVKANEVDFEKENLIIKGNNLLVLHSLEKRYAGKVKLIYIDPPYNTGGDAESFTYNNTFKHSTWLTFMFNRLNVAKILLREDGFIAITIDHVELFYLGTLADEVFGRENRVGIVSIVHKPEGRNQEKFFGTSNEFMMIYAKNKDCADFEQVILDENQQLKFEEVDKDGKYRLKNFIRLTDGKYSLRENKPSHFYPIYISADLSDFSLERKEGYMELLPITDKGIERTWKTKGQTFIKLVSSGSIEAKYEEGRLVLYEKLREDQVIKTHWIKKEYHAYHFGTKLLEKILGRKAFSFPKSLYAVKDTLKLMTSGDDIILDFHAGSGTTAHATLVLNKEDGGNRRFILVEQLDEHIEICNERMQKVLQQENSNASFIYCEPVRLNQSFIDQVQSAKSTKELLGIWENMQKQGFLSYRLDAKVLDGNAEEFTKMTLEEQKKILLSTLDHNHLYVNYSEMEDKDYAVSDKDKALNTSFYAAS